MPDTLPRHTAPLFRLLAEHTRRLCLPRGDTPAERRTIANLALTFVGGKMTQEQRQELLALYRSPVRVCPPQQYALLTLALIAEGANAQDEITVRRRVDTAQFQKDLDACLIRLRDVIAQVDAVLAGEEEGTAVAHA